MKTFFKKWRIFAVLDTGRAIPARLRGEFADKAVALDSELKRAVPELKDSPSLHASIMRAVRQAESAKVKPKTGVVWWVPASAVATVALLGVIWWNMQFSKPVSEPQLGAQSLTMALDMGNQMPMAVQSVVMDPMAEELERFNQDLTNTADFLLASLP